jgi:hypothetical protein
MSAATQIVAAKHRRWRDGLTRTYAGTSHSSTCQIPPFSPVHFARTRAQAGPTGAMRSVVPERTRPTFAKSRRFRGQGSRF